MPIIEENNKEKNMRKLFVIATLMLVVAFAAANVGQAFAVGTGGSPSYIATGDHGGKYSVGMGSVIVKGCGSGCEVTVTAGMDFPYLPLTVSVNKPVQLEVCFPGSVSIFGVKGGVEYPLAAQVNADKMTCATTWNTAFNVFTYK